MDNILIAALQYASMGWPVFPLNHITKTGECSCHNLKCNAPGKHPVTQNGLKDATTNPTIINNWWKVYPSANIGLVTGAKSGFVVLDIDPRHGGTDTLLNLEAAEGKLPTTLESLTGGGGKHIFFKHPGGRILNNQNGKFGAGIDIRADGGYIVAPPSNHISGNLYMWEASSDPTMQIADAPQWVLNRLTKDVQGGGTNNNPKNTKPNHNGSQKINQGRRNSSLTSYAGKLRKLGNDEQQILAALKVYNQSNCNPPLSDAELQAIAKSISKYAGQAPDDDEIAQTWLDEHPDTCYGLGEFRRYSDGIWPPIEDHKIEFELAGIMERYKGSGVKTTYYKLHSIKEMARIRSAVSDALWNADPNLIVCKNGTLHIPTKQLQPHKPENYLTSGIPYDFDKNARAFSWMNFLNDLHPDIVSFVQEYAGYCMTTETKYEVAVWLYGPPGCGKSTLIAGILTMLGNRAGLLGLHDIEKNQFALENLPGKTMVYSTEQPADYMSATHILNALISGESVTVNRKYKKAFELYPQAKIMWAMNDMPRVGDANNGIFRRIHVIPFHKLTHAANPTLKEEIALEGSGILLWALEGLERLRMRGRFAVPQIISDASNRFKLDNDVPQMFVRECCEINATYETNSNDLYISYRDWCFKNGYKAMSSNTVSRAWERFGFVHKKTNTNNKWQGVRLLSAIP